MKILFVTDASSDLQPELVEGKPIVIVPATIHAGGKEYRDFYDIKPEEYWEMLKNLTDVPTTTMATPGEYLETYKKAHEDGYTHICVTQISSTASGTMNSAIIARDMLVEEGITDMTIEVIDTLNYTMAYGHTVLEGVKMAIEGISFEKITARIKELCQRAEVVFSVFTLKYLRKTGRASGMAAFAGELLGIRPILLAGKGEVKPVSKIRGDANVLDGIVEYVKKRKNSAEKYMSIIHADISKEVITRLEQLLEQNFGVKNLPKFKIGAAVTTHAGPLTIGVLFYSQM
jgi:DegV family protein with EDD domain